MPWTQLSYNLTVKYSFSLKTRGNILTLTLFHNPSSLFFVKACSIRLDSVTQVASRCEFIVDFYFLAAADELSTWSKKSVVTFTRATPLANPANVGRSALSLGNALFKIAHNKTDPKLNKVLPTKL